MANPNLSDDSVLPAPRRFLTPFASLMFRTYRMLWLTQVGAASAMWTEQVTRNWLTYQLTDSPLQLGLVNLMQAGPIGVLGLWGGVLTDRFDKRRLLQVIQIWNLTIYATMATIVLTGHLQLWHLYASSFAVAIGMSLDNPLRTSTIPSLVPQQRLINALSLNGVAINGTRLLLPTAVGILIATANPGWAYLSLVIIFVINLGLSVQLDFPPVQGKDSGRSMARQLGDGVRFAATNHDVLSVLLIAVGVQGIGFASRALIPVLAAERLHAGSTGYGFLLSADGAGAVIFGLILATVGLGRHKGIVVSAFAAANAIGIVCIGWMSVIYIAAIFSMTIGGTSTVFRSSSNSLLLGHTPPNMRGRVMSINGLNPGIAPISIAIMGAVAQATNVSIALTLIGGASLLLNGMVILFHRRALDL